MKASQVKTKDAQLTPEKECVICKKKTRHPYAYVNGGRQCCCSSICYDKHLKQ